MCKFCDVITTKRHNKKIGWSVNNTSEYDNVEEILESRNNERWIEDYSDFNLIGYAYEGNTFVSVEYRKEISSEKNEKVVINPFSGLIQFNFCPICGDRISEDVMNFDEYNEYVISIEDIWE